MRSDILDPTMTPSTRQGTDPGARPAHLDGILRRVAAGSPLPVVVRGSCMAPLAADGCRVEVAPQPRYRSGDVVVYRAAGGELRMHRVILALPGGRLVTRADAARRADATVPGDRILGRVVGGEVAPDLLTPPWHHRLQARLHGLVWPFQALARRWRIRRGS